MKGTDMKGHLITSIAKSIIRISAGVFVIGGHFYLCGVALILAEFLGIVEEFV